MKKARPFSSLVILKRVNNHSHSTIIHSFKLHHSPRPHRFFVQQEKNFYGVPSQESNSGLHYRQMKHFQLSYAAPNWVTPHSSKVRRTQLSYTPHPTELRHNRLSYSAIVWATPLPTELRHTQLSYAAPNWATPHPTELRRTPLSYATPNWASLSFFWYSHSIFSVPIFLIKNVYAA